MEDNDQQNINSNPFFTRGCCAVPDAHSEESTYSPSCAKLSSFDWLKDIELAPNEQMLDIIEVRFKNSKKDFFRVVYGNTYSEGDIVAVESSPGHDLGIVTLTGEAVKLQLKKKKFRLKSEDFKKLYPVYLHHTPTGSPGSRFQIQDEYSFHTMHLYCRRMTIIKQ